VEPTTAPIATAPIATTPIAIAGPTTAPIWFDELIALLEVEGIIPTAPTAIVKIAIVEPIAIAQPAQWRVDRQLRLANRPTAPPCPTAPIAIEEIEDTIAAPIATPIVIEDTIATAPIAIVETTPIAIVEPIATVQQHPWRLWSRLRLADRPTAPMAKGVVVPPRPTAPMAKGVVVPPHLTAPMAKGVVVHGLWAFKARPAAITVRPPSCRIPGTVCKANVAKASNDDPMIRRFMQHPRHAPPRSSSIPKWLGYPYPNAPRGVKRPFWMDGP
jgi:hypothetical protein